jgi:hypothetical protein
VGAVSVTAIQFHSGVAFQFLAFQDFSKSVLDVGCRLKNQTDQVDFEQVIEAWKKASIDLRIVVVAPFRLNTESEVLEFPMLVHAFGTEKGTIVLDIDDSRNISKIPEKYGFHCSRLGSSYAQYVREEFIDTLEDWGYYGDSQHKPNWYEGKYYQEK